MNRIHCNRTPAVRDCLAVIALATSLAACDSSRTEPSVQVTPSPPPMSAATPVPAPAPAPTPAPAAPGTMGGKAVSAADVEFVSSAASAGTLKVEASRLALEKTKTPAVRNFAQKMVEENAAVGAEMRALNVASSVGNVATMNPKDAERLRKLRELQGREFDREYAAQIGVGGHEEAVNAFQTAAASASDTQLKTFAQAKLPALREHLKIAQALAKTVGASAAGQKNDPLAAVTADAKK